MLWGVCDIHRQCWLPTTRRLESDNMSASRTELIAWLNELLALNYTKVEQCGNGAAYAQIIDSIYGKSGEISAHTY